MNVSIPFRPGLADVSMGCSPGDFQAGSVAGITVGTVALPLAMERINRVLNFPATSFSAANHSRWLPEPDKTNTVGGREAQRLGLLQPHSRAEGSRSDRG
jgi:hypothetical protein